MILGAVLAESVLSSSTVYGESYQTRPGTARFDSKHVCFSALVAHPTHANVAWADSLFKIVTHGQMILVQLFWFALRVANATHDIIISLTLAPYGGGGRLPS